MADRYQIRDFCPVVATSGATYASWCITKDTDSTRTEVAHLDNAGTFTLQGSLFAKSLIQCSGANSLCLLYGTGQLGFRFQNTDGATDQKYFEINQYTSGVAEMRFVNDAYSVGSNIFSFVRTGGSYILASITAGAIFRAPAFGVAGGSDGIDGTMTTASLVGKTLTFSKGIIVGFS
jgi:hypothetical protein